MQRNLAETKRTKEQEQVIKKQEQAKALILTAITKAVGELEKLVDDKLLSKV